MLSEYFSQFSSGFSRSKKIALAVLLLFVVVILLFLTFVNFKKENKTAEVSPIRPRVVSRDESLSVITSSKEPKVGEVFTILATSTPAKQLQKAVFLVNGKVVKACVTSMEDCSFDLGPFGQGDVGSVYKYEVETTSADGTKESYSGSFVVASQDGQEEPPATAAPLTGAPAGTGQSGSQAPSADQSQAPTPIQSQTPAPAPTPTPTTPAPAGSIQIEKIITSGSQLKVGELFSSTISVKPNTKINQINASVDKIKVKSCDNTLTCSFVVGPMNSADVGQHSYEFVIIAADGQKKSAGGLFSVVAVEQPPVSETEKDWLAPKVDVSSNKASVKATETVVLTVTASDASGIKKITIAWGDKIAKECSNANECVYTAGPFAGISQETKVIYGATATDMAGNAQSTAAKSIIIVPADQIVEPSVSMDSASMSILSTATVNFSVQVDSGNKKLNYINCYVNNQVAKVCNGNCSFVAGPFPDYVGGAVGYYAKAYFTDGSTKSSPVKNISVVNAKSDIQPAMSIETDKSTYNPYDVVKVAIKVDPGSKVFDSATLFEDDNKSIGSCTTQICNLTIDLKAQMKSEGFYKELFAAAYFKDGTTLASGKKKIYIKPFTPEGYIKEQLGTAVVIVSPASSEVESGQQIDISVLVDSGNKSLSLKYVTLHGIGQIPLTKNCTGNACHFDFGPFITWSGETYELFAVAFFSDPLGLVEELPLTSEKKQVYVKPADVKPQVSLELGKASIKINEKTAAKVIVAPGSKVVKKVTLSVGGEFLSKECYALTCSFEVGPFYKAYQNIPVFAAAFYEGSAVPEKSAVKQIYIEPGQATIGSFFGPDVRNIFEDQWCKISSFLDPSGREISSHEIYVNNSKKATCAAVNCSYENYAFSMLGQHPTQDTILYFYSRATFFDGTSVKSATGSVTVKPL